jgi:hypothetical protein
MAMLLLIAVSGWQIAPAAGGSEHRPQAKASTVVKIASYGTRGALTTKEKVSTLNLNLGQAPVEERH